MKSKAAFTTIFLLTVLLTLAWQTSTLKAEIVTDGLVSYWSFDEDTIAGQTVKDSWGENHGTIQGNGLKTVEGEVHEAMEFPGTGDHIVIADNDNSLDMETEMSLMAWVIWGGDPSTIICKRNPTNYQFTLFQPPHNIQLCTGDACKYSPEPLESDQWMHVAAIRLNNEIFYYIDGESAGTLPEPAGWSVNDADARIGTNGPEGGDQHFGGVIDELLIYNRALSKDEVNHNLNAAGLAVDSNGKLSLTWGEIKFSR